MRSPFSQDRTQVASRVRRLDLRHTLWGAQRHNVPASVPTVWPQIDDIIGSFDDIKVVLDDEHGVATVHQAAQNLEQALDIREVQTGRRLIQNVQGASRAAPAQLAAELHTLGLTTRERSRSLAQADWEEARAAYGEFALPGAWK